MEPLAPVGLDSSRSRPLGWQLAMRVDYVVSQVMLSHRGQPEEQVARAITERLRGIGAPANARQVQQYAHAISQLPPIPPQRGPGVG